MGQYYILKSGIIEPIGFNTLEECREWGIQEGFGEFAVIQLVDFIQS